MGLISTIAMISVLLLANAFFVAAEFALISSRRDRIESLIIQGRPGAQRVLHAIETLSIQLAACQFGITIASLILGKVAEPAVAHFLEEVFHEVHIPDQLLHPISFAIALGLITFLHILFGEMVPKNIALAGPETLAIWLTPLLLAFAKLARPFIALMNSAARRTLFLFGIEQKDELAATVDNNQLASMILESRSEGLLNERAHERLSKALNVEARPLADVLIPLEKVRTLNYGVRGPQLSDLEQAVVETGFSRFPVVDDRGAFKGYVHVKDILDRFLDGNDYGADSIIHSAEIRPLTIVDASGAMDEALTAMHLKSAHMAQVRDRGVLIGIVTLEDIIEEYVGTFADWTHGQ
ncbi:hemolysin family protein [Corynebacterium sp. ES2794-CONJ1]|uniref:hemolysin family protein n=1 Tax=unclassified Corynebacterium TaxID=2624378 RepID=UPI002169B152|nr:MULTISPECIES: hemolysin family protein [unclassified Corynebacterium]MCS4489373.1 hemolysin family protein [Corynebacterium sp. ES2775-CONJ]MCS4530933.1 hemolysin family protein [Corynebacterium sp. ES2730-CONJ]MCU9518300.1 hemolysin family protein [Corynebacterium sp. ES2794-CONJ1]